MHILEVLRSLPDINSEESELQQGPDKSIDELSVLIAKIKCSSNLSPRLKDNLIRLAGQVEEKTEDTEQKIRQFRNEIAIWFEQSMVHFSRTYRRNVKALTVVTSAILAFLVNADTLYMIRRISENTATRSVIIQNAAQMEGCQNDFSSEQCMNNMASLLDSTILPIGWHSVNRQIQFSPFNVFKVFRAMIGWLLTGIAISMGSRFWFQLLDRFIHIRDTGESPRSIDEMQR